MGRIYADTLQKSESKSAEKGDLLKYHLKHNTDKEEQRPQTNNRNYSRYVFTRFTLCQEPYKAVYSRVRVLVP